MNHPMKKLLIVGAGEFAKIAYEYFTYDSNYEVEAFFVEKNYLKESRFLSKPLLALEEISSHYSPSDYEVFIAVTSSRLNRDRARLFDQVKRQGYQLASYVSSRASTWRDLNIGENVFVFEGNNIQPFVTIGDNVILWSGNHIGHSSVIEDHVFVTSHVVISGHCTVGKFSFLGVNASVADEVHIARDNFISMGAAVTKSTQENSIYRGNPAEKLKMEAKKFCRVKELQILSGSQ